MCLYLSVSVCIVVLHCLFCARAWNRSWGPLGMFQFEADGNWLVPSQWPGAGQPSTLTHLEGVNFLEPLVYKCESS